MATSSARLYSIIIPLYNRPQEIEELLKSLTHQKYTNFEVIVVDDGSQPPAKSVIEAFNTRLNLQYLYQSNAGQGMARNAGFAIAKGEYFIVFDSDCLIPEDYLINVDEALTQYEWDAFGGPDRAHPSFSALQKAISYSMTSTFTTGGIRGNKKHLGIFHPRSFNMGISRETWNRTGGFRWRNQSEDMEFSIRMHEMGLKVGLIPDAAVYHKRRVNFLQFFKQTFSFGQGRVRLHRNFKGQLKVMHMLPAAYALGVILLLIYGIAVLINPKLTIQLPMLQSLMAAGFSLFLFYKILIFIDSLRNTQSLHIATLSIFAVFIQFMAYGLGFIKDFFFSDCGSKS